MRSFLDVVLGRSLASAEEGEQTIGPLAGVPVPGLDALSSSAYGPEAAAHYQQMAAALATREPLDLNDRYPAIVIVPIRSWNRLSLKALNFALDISEDVVGVFVDNGEEPSSLKDDWELCAAKLRLTPWRRRQLRLALGCRRPTWGNRPVAYRFLLRPALVSV